MCHIGNILKIGNLHKIFHQKQDIHIPTYSVTEQNTTKGFANPMDHDKESIIIECTQKWLSTQNANHTLFQMLIYDSVLEVNCPK